MISVIDMLILLFAWIITFAWIAFILFAQWEDVNINYSFHLFTDSIIHMQILLTTSNFPDIMV